LSGCVKEQAPCQKAKAAQQLQPQFAGENNSQLTTTDNQPAPNNYQTATINWAGRVSEVARQFEMQHPRASLLEILTMIIQHSPFKILLPGPALP
jgi:hypothetical protein